MTSTSVTTIRIGADHPALPGHFPGNPLVPGVVLLAKIIALVQTKEPTGAHVKGLFGVKFLAHMNPEETVQVAFSPVRPGTIRFECSRGDMLIATGNLELQVGRITGAAHVG